MVVALAYTTAILETWSISAYPHYWYPSLRTMLLVGSAFYSLFFAVTYPLFFHLWGRRRPSPRPLYDTVVNACACCTLIYFAYEAWTTILGSSVY